MQVFNRVCQLTQQGLPQGNSSSRRMLKRLWDALGRLQLRARTPAQHPVLDLLYPAFAALSAFEGAALASALELPWSPDLAEQVSSWRSSQLPR